jgi:hypothetical protein
LVNQGHKKYTKDMHSSIYQLQVFTYDNS